MQKTARLATTHDKPHKYVPLFINPATYNLDQSSLFSFSLPSTYGLVSDYTQEAPREVMNQQSHRVAVLINLPTQDNGKYKQGSKTCRSGGHSDAIPMACVGYILTLLPASLRV